ncbi:AMP-binding protein [Jutongia hominis]|uniref:AMP-binding protein n=1 Tax=Jutongia hominis TaxID=2763664 RepID=A0ABR7MRL1_9FIRM|nr:AMP-binding protein [Jutongia hominis]MBC8556441.1 AMP-binding protein [Jutongia hominis]
MKYKPYDLYELPKINDLKDMLFQKKKMSPDKIAFTFSKGKNIVSKTYTKVFDDVNSFGTWLYEKKHIGKHIAIIGENSYEWLMTFFAVTCGGNVVVPIDKELPENEIARLLETVDVEIIFFSKSYRQLVTNVVELLKKKITIYCMADMQNYIEIGKEQFTSWKNAFSNYKIDSKQLCCIMFTSGTSGNSKGVMLSHENIVEDINNSCKLFILEGNTIAVLPFHHAFGLVVAVLMAFNYGHTIYINKSLKTIQKDLQIAKPQTMFLVPLFVEMFHKQIWITAKKESKEKSLQRMMKLSDFLLKFGIDVRKKVFAHIRNVFGGAIEYIICGGAPLGIQYVKEFRSFGIEILNGYGTTECSPCVAVNRNLYHKDGTVGVVVPGIDVKISNSREVLVKGSIVMLGYYNAADSNKEVFRDGWYKTGDLGYLDDDGFLTLTGRCKNLIILSNGENVSPEELEADFLEYDEIQEVLVYEEDGMIIAEIYPNEECLVKKAELEFLQEHFDNICREINSKRPLYKQVKKIKLRNSEFEKNTSRKILRYKRKENTK